MKGPPKEIESGLCLNLPFHESVYRRISVVRLDFYVWIFMWLVTKPCTFIHLNFYVVCSCSYHTHVCVCVCVCVFSRRTSSTFERVKMPS